MCEKQEELSSAGRDSNARSGAEQCREGAEQRREEAEQCREEAEQGRELKVVDTVRDSSAFTRETHHTVMVASRSSPENGPWL